MTTTPKAKPRKAKQPKARVRTVGNYANYLIPAGYRQVMPGETKQKGDRSRNGDGRWLVVWASEVGTKVPEDSIDHWIRLEDKARIKAK